MALKDWVDFSVSTPLSAARMNSRDELLEASLVQLARDPEALFAGAVTRDANEAPISAIVEWPDKENGVAVTGTYSGTASVNFPGSISSYTITRITNAGTKTFTQPAVTRNAAGNVVNRPPIVIS